MIALLTGRLAHKAPDSVILDVNGVGYRVQIPFSTYFDLPEPGATVTLNIHTHVKEDAIHLYGFRTVAEKQTFQLLIGVSGIGPKMARDILSNIAPGELSLAIAGSDLARLSAIPGIGRKTAERLVVELREKMQKLDLPTPSRQTAATAATPDISDDVASALVNLGYKEAQVRKVLSDLELPAGVTVETALKLALKVLLR